MNWTPAKQDVGTVYTSKLEGIEQGLYSTFSHTVSWMEIYKQTLFSVDVPEILLNVGSRLIWPFCDKQKHLSNKHTKFAC